jgi:mycothiol synthase
VTTTDRQLVVRDLLDPAEVAEVSALVESATDSDGVSPLSEHVLLHLAHGGDARARNLLLREDGRLVGYAHLDVTDPVAGPSAELVVDPHLRRQGAGRALLEAVQDAAGGGRLRLWAHGEQPGASALAHTLGYRRARVLWQMRRSLHAPLPQPSYPGDVTVRTFRPGEDEVAWVEVNRRAFSDLPDQGSWDIEDIRLREAEPWFDAQGFFLAERADRLIGFHWTKVHGGSASGGHPHSAVGEVYVVGVDPDAQGEGLGRALTLTGLRHLRALRLDSAMLYVDEGNTAAIALYQGLGFSRWDTDVTYVRDAPAR